MPTALKKPKRKAPRRGSVLEAAYLKAVKRMTDPSIVASEVNAGSILTGKRGSRVGLQVFVKVCLFSEELLIKQPLTGGLVCLVKGKQ